MGLRNLAFSVFLYFIVIGASYLAAYVMGVDPTQLIAHVAIACVAFLYVYAEDKE